MFEDVTPSYDGMFHYFFIFYGLNNNLTVLPLMSFLFLLCWVDSVWTD